MNWYRVSFDVAASNEDDALARIRQVLFDHLDSAVDPDSFTTSGEVNTHHDPGGAWPVDAKNFAQDNKDRIHVVDPSKPFHYIQRRNEEI